MPGTLFLCGAGNSEGVRLALAVNHALQRWERIVLLDDDPTKIGERKLGVEVTGPLSDLHLAARESDSAANLVARTTTGRRAVRERIVASGVVITPLVSADIDTSGVELADDVIVYRHATLGPESVIHEGSVVFMGAVVGHECVVGAGSVIAANAVLNARVVLDEGVYFGSGATVLPEVRIGAWATIGASSLVLQDVPAGASVLGVPAEIVHGREDARHFGALASAGDQPRSAGAARLTLSQLTDLVAEAWGTAVGPVTDLDVCFFDAGGFSLSALRVRERLRESTGIQVPVTDLFRFPTVRSLAEHLVNGGGVDLSAPMRRAGAPKLAARRLSRE